MFELVLSGLSVLGLIVLTYIMWGSISNLKASADNLSMSVYKLTKPLPVAAELLSNSWVAALQENDNKLQKIPESK